MENRKESRIAVQLNLNVRGLQPSATLRINERSAELARQGKSVYRLGFGQSPFPVPEPVVHALRDNAHQKDYLPVKGLRELREAVAKFHNRHTGSQYTAEDVLIGPGSKELMFLLQLVYYGDLVIPRPSWVSYAPQARIAARQVHWVPTKEEENWLMTPAQLEKLCAKDPTHPRLLILNYPANPTGATYSEDDLKAMAEVLEKYGVVVLSDEIYGEVHHDGTHKSIASYYPEGTIISSGLSKWCGAGGWRLGTFAFPESMRWLLNAMAVAASETFTSTSTPVQYAAVRAFQNGPDLEEYLQLSRMALKVVGQAVSDLLDDNNISHPAPQGGFYVFPNFEAYRGALADRNILTSEELCENLLNETGVALLPASDFGFPEEFLGARLSYVDFDGGAALEYIRGAASQNYQDAAALAEQIAPKVMEGVRKIVEWVKIGMRDEG
ncbi:MAG: aspartate aminotransferase [Saprospirales bacterium]|nr:aspartate aminotransferase [Saprospirales bacterium]